MSTTASSSDAGVARMRTDEKRGLIRRPSGRSIRSLRRCGLGGIVTAALPDKNPPTDWLTEHGIRPDE